jgi:putative lipoprotein
MRCVIRHVITPFLWGLAIGGCATSQLPQITEVADARPSAVPGRAYAFACDQFAFAMRGGPDQVVLYLPDRDVILARIPSASGTRYQQGDTEFWNKGDEAMLTVGAKRHLNCKVDPARSAEDDARLRAVRFRATGNEPGWQLEIEQSRWIRFVGDYGSTMVYMPAPAPVFEDGRTTYRAQSQEHDLAVIIEQSACADDMSGERFAARVTVWLDGRKFRGCGRAVR